jgi:hypothetical protein
MWSASHGAERDRHEDPRNIGPEGDPKQDPERLEDGRTRLVFERRAPQQPGTYWVHLVGSRLQQCCNPVGFASVAVQIEVVAPEPEKKLGALQGPTLDGLRNVRRSFESAGRSTTTVPTVIDPDPASSVPRLVIPQPARAVRHRAEPMAAMPAAPTAVMAPAMPIERPGTTVLGPGPDAPPAATPARIVVPGSGARGVLTPVAPAPAVTTPKTTGTPPAATGATPATILGPGRARVDVRGGIGLGPATPTTLPPASGGRLLR